MLPACFEVLRKSIANSSVVDPKLILLDPDPAPTFLRVLDPDPDPA
jgi:hypothetical protein